MKDDDLRWPEDVSVDDVGYGKLTVSGTTDFGPVTLGHRAVLTMWVTNTGNRNLHVRRVAFLPPCPCDVLNTRSSPGRCRHGGTRDEAGMSVIERPAASADDEAARLCDQCCLSFSIAANPFPAVLNPGSCLAVSLEFAPTCRSAACCELVIESDDPANPRQISFVTGHLRRTFRAALKCWMADELQEILHAAGR